MVNRQSMSHLTPTEIDEGCDQLHRMLELQREFNKRFLDESKLTLEDKQEWTKRLLLAMFNEMAELQDQINWKWWKKPVPVNEHEIMFELIDIQMFLNSLYQIWGMDYKMVASYFEAKMQENHNRQKRGY